MAIKWTAAGAKTELKKAHTIGSAKERFYIDFRQLAYPAVGEDFGYTLVTSGANKPGSHNLTSGHGDFMLPLTSKLTVRAYVLPTFAYTAVNQPLWSWYYDATSYLEMLYSTTYDAYVLYWQDGGTLRRLVSPAYTSDEDLQVWTMIDCAIDLTTGDTTGSALYINRVAVDTGWSGNIDAKTKLFPKFSLRHFNTTEGGFTVNHVRIFPNKVATAAEVAADYSGVTNEEIYFSLDGFALGRSRCNVTRFVQGFGYGKSVKDPKSGAAGANTLTLRLLNESGELSDDQYAAFDPTSDQFNGLVTQKYLQTRCRVEAEVWYSNSYDPFFIGQVDDAMFSRRSMRGDMSMVEIRAEDIVARIGRKYKRKSVSYEDKDLSDATETNSLVHLIARLATQEDIYNFVANSSFENATIGNSWAVAGGTAPTFSRVAGGVFGSYQGDLVYDDATCNVTQIVTFTGTKKLNVGEKWTFSLWLKAAANANGDLTIYEQDSGGDNDSTAAAYDTITGGAGWELYQVTHTITDSDSDRLTVKVSLESDTTLSMDGAMLIQGGQALNWFVLNNNDGASATESADDADSDSYDTCGFDCDAVDIQHGWVIIDEGAPIWEELKQIGDAVAALYIGADESGTFKLRAKLQDESTARADPTSLETIAAAAGVMSEIEQDSVNKLVGHGVKIAKTTALKILWSAEASGVFDFMSDRLIDNNDYFPDPEDDGGATARYLAKYGAV